MSSQVMLSPAMQHLATQLRAIRLLKVSNPDPEISDEAFQSACEDVALQMRNRTDDLAELISVAAEVAPALSYIASIPGKFRQGNGEMRCC